MRELLVFIFLAEIVALGAYIVLSDMSLEDTARLSAISTIVLLLAFTALTLWRVLYMRMMSFIKKHKLGLIGNLLFIPAFMLSSPFDYAFASFGFATIFIGIYIDAKKTRN